MIRPEAHSDACNRIRLAVSELGGLTLPYTVGKFIPYNYADVDRGRVVTVGIPGASDIVACIGGRFVAIEVKVGRDEQRADQHSFEAAVQAAGGLYVLARFTDAEDGVETLQRALTECKLCGELLAACACSRAEYRASRGLRT